MKILDIHDVSDRYQPEWWNVNQSVLSRWHDGVHFHEHTFPFTIVEHRIAEYDMDPGDIDSVLHLVLHEPCLRKEDVNCYSKGYSQSMALKARLSRIQTEIDKHALRMEKGQRGIQPHKHARLDPIRRRGIDLLYLEATKHHVAGVMAGLNGNVRESLVRRDEHERLMELWTKSRSTLRN